MVSAVRISMHPHEITECPRVAIDDLPPDLGSRCASSNIAKATEKLAGIKRDTGANALYNAAKSYLDALA